MYTTLVKMSPLITVLAFALIKLKEVTVIEVRILTPFLVSTEPNFKHVSNMAEEKVTTEGWPANFLKTQLTLCPLGSESWLKSC